MLQSDIDILPRPDVPADLWDVLNRLARVAAGLSARIARGGIDEALGTAVGTNTDGDAQKSLDLIADSSFLAALQGSDIAWYASEEREAAEGVTKGGGLALAIDPLDGSSNIDVNVSIGTIFGLFPAAADAEASFLRPASEIIAAGYFIYGPQTCLVVSWGQGLRKYTLDPQTRRFHLSADAVEVPPQTSEFSINASNYHHWPTPVRAFIDDLVRGAEGPRGRAFNMRWIASLVAETHRIVTRGGVFLYPSDSRKGYERGRLRLLYECAPIAFLVLQGGGGATDGTDPILSHPIRSLHQRTPFVFGSREKVARVATYFDMSHAETSALFGKRGLFRS